jgi:ferrochelatase
MKTGLLLINLGTPDSPKTSDVRSYLREFLSDPRVIDLPFLGRWLLLNLIILPFRPRRSSKAYQKVWTEEGSPLKVEGLKLASELNQILKEEDVPVVLAMRYGNPSIAKGLKELRSHQCDRLLILPLFPQYASSTTGSALEAVYRAASQDWNISMLEVIPSFYDHPDFIKAFAVQGEQYMKSFPDHILFSFHGLPERHLFRGDEENHGCLKRDDCCSMIENGNRNCYRAQSFKSAELIASHLKLDPEQWSVSFQSRLGRAEWIKPYTENRIRELGQKGLKKLLVFCPAFVAECLETLEEIQIGAKEIFLEEGGDDLVMVPSLNATPDWIQGISRMVRERL